MRKTLITSPVTEPVTLAEAKAFARIDCADDDTLITSFITQARQYAEKFTKRRFGSQVWTLTLDRDEIMKCLQIEEFDVQTVNSITVYDEDDNATVVPVAEYGAYNNRIIFELASYTLRPLDAMVINYTVGGETIPEQVKLGILQIIATWYEFRESIISGTIVDIVPSGAMANLAPYIIYTI